MYKHVGGKGQRSEENMAPHLYKTNQLSDQQQTPAGCTQAKLERLLRAHRAVLPKSRHSQARRVESPMTSLAQPPFIGCCRARHWPQLSRMGIRMNRWSIKINFCCCCCCWAVRKVPKSCFFFVLFCDKSIGGGIGAEALDTWQRRK